MLYVATDTVTQDKHMAVSILQKTRNFSHSLVVISCWIVRTTNKLYKSQISVTVLIGSLDWYGRAFCLRKTPYHLKRETNRSRRRSIETYFKN